MSIESIKRWQWIIIGAIVGLIIAAVRIQTGVTAPLETTRAGLPLADFVDLASNPPASSGKPLLHDLTIYPPVDGKNLITGEYLHSPGFFSASKYIPFQVSAPVPFRLPQGPNAPSPTYTIRDHLAKTNPTLSYRYVWYSSDSAQYLVWTAGSALVLGGLWPLVLRFLVGAGYGRKLPPEPDYDLDRFKSTEAPPTYDPAPASPEGAARLEALNQSLEAQLATTPTTATTQASDQSAPAIVVLSNTPYEPEAAPDQADHPKDYKGEFYPVARSGQKNGG